MRGARTRLTANPSPRLPNRVPLSIPFKPPAATPAPDDDGLGDALRPPQQGINDFDGDVGAWI